MGWINVEMDTWIIGQMIGQMSGWRERFKLEAQIQARLAGSDSSLEALMLWSAYVSRGDQDRLGPLETLFVFKACTGFAQTKWLRFKPGGSDASVEAEIQAGRLRFKPRGLDSRRLKYIHGLSSSQDPFPRLPEYWFYWFYWFYLFFEGFICFLGDGMRIT